MDPDEAEMFIEAQDGVWKDVQSELEAGKKTTHWMWFVFPQLAALGQSDMSQLFGLHDLEEARDYLEEPTLGPRLIEMSKLLLTHDEKSAEEILGAVDAMKLRSSMTLFREVPGADGVFGDVLEAFFGGKPCERTLAELG
ncbi:DUF1810 domain-containing protein [Maritimibacter sp. DP1N21-5]|uniref:DUF1810 domain-containing protein n=1 Tax=Maritimibacter sp. DP1N21-5 TaxID=2836867 RepID=UPI001C45574B|nr:DUF1810 domain-containing protein [Maritimibacter sp. DP1N21-5]MBV7411001.1 DUF1810 domain-containing protein [Maritimibacter sp. DP1N21-5]